MKRSRPIRLVLLVSSCCLGLLLSELALRFLIRAAPFERPLVMPGYLTSRELSLRWRYPSSAGRNRLGLRNREVGPKQPGAYRVLFLGDSLIDWGDTSSGELYTAVLERRLNSRATSGATIEVINAGVPGYTTYQELEFLKIHGLAMKPDFVVLGFVLNDLFYKYQHKPTDQNLLDREPATRLYGFNPDVFPGKLVARSYLAHEAIRRVQFMWKRLSGRPTFPFEENTDAYLAWKDYGWSAPRALIGEMHSILAQRGIAFVMAVFPISQQVEDRYRTLDEAYVLYPQRKILEIAEAYEIPLLDLTDTIYRHGAATLFRDYVHLTARGNDVVANELERFLARRLPH